MFILLVFPGFNFRPALVCLVDWVLISSRKVSYKLLDLIVQFDFFRKKGQLMCPATMLQCESKCSEWEQERSLFQMCSSEMKTLGPIHIPIIWSIMNFKEFYFPFEVCNFLMEIRIFSPLFLPTIIHPVTLWRVLSWPNI